MSKSDCINIDKPSTSIENWSNYKNLFLDKYIKFKTLQYTIDNLKCLQI